MKRQILTLLFSAFFCAVLALSGCSEPAPAPTVERPTLPALVEPVSPAQVYVSDLERLQALLPNQTILSAEDLTPAGGDADLRLVRCRFAFDKGGVGLSEDYLIGPAGVTPAGGSAVDPLWADADGDGAQELIFWSVGPTSGILTVELRACGLEQGIPVCKAAQALLVGNHGDLRLERDGETPVLCVVPYVWNAEANENLPDKAERVPLRVERGEFVSASGELPEGISFAQIATGSSLINFSFSLLKTLWADTLVYESPACLISSPAENNKSFRAVVTQDGIRVSGCQIMQDAGRTWETGFTPIHAPGDLSALAELSMQELTERLGPPHFDDGSGLRFYGWFLDDYRLLRAAGTEQVFCLFYYDPFYMSLKDNVEGLACPDAPDGLTDAIVVSTVLSKTVFNLARWNAFLENTGKGEPDAVTLCRLQADSAAAWKLRYDGEKYLLNDGERADSYPYLLTVDEPHRREEARQSATHYYLSDFSAEEWDDAVSRAASAARILSSSGFVAVLPPISGITPTDPATWSAEHQHYIELFTVYREDKG